MPVLGLCSPPQKDPMGQDGILGSALLHPVPRWPLKSHLHFHPWVRGYVVGMKWEMSPLWHRGAPSTTRGGIYCMREFAGKGKGRGGSGIPPHLQLANFWVQKQRAVSIP